MRITLCTQDPRVEVAIPAVCSPEIADEEYLDRLIRTLQQAKAWLRKEKAKKKK